MKKWEKWKKVLLFTVLGIVGLFGCFIGYIIISDKIEASRAEKNLALAQKELENNNFKALDSLVKIIGYKYSRVENGEEKFKELEKGIERGKFRAQVDEMRKFTKEKKYTQAEDLSTKILIESVQNEVLKEEDKDYFHEAMGEIRKAKANEMKPYLEKAKEGLGNIYVKEDKFNDILLYKENTSPRYVDANGFFLLFGGNKSLDFVHSLSLKVQYYGDDWLFHDEFKLLVDGKAYTFRPKEVKRDNGNGGYVWEWSVQRLEDYPSEMYTSNILADVINSKETILRFEGRKYYEEFTLTQLQKKALKNVILAYVAKGGYFPYIDKIVK